MPDLFFRQSRVLGDVDTKLRNALAEAGYKSNGYFWVPGGFALVTRLEQINEDGTPRPGNERWEGSPPGPLRTFDMKAILRSLGHERVGYFRVIAIFVTDQPFSSSPKKPAPAQALEWPLDGNVELHPEIARWAYSSGYAVTAYVYEFEKHEGRDSSFRTPGRLTCDTHLEMAGLLPRLRSE